MKIMICPETNSVPLDIYLFDEVQKECRKLFLAKREDYGNHLEKTKRFPLYNKGLVYEKGTRFILDLEHNNEQSKDMLLDLIVGAIMVRTEQLIKEGTICIGG